MKCNAEERDDEEGGMMKCNAEPCQRSEKKERHLPDTGIRRVVPVPVSNTDTTPKMACPCNLGREVRTNEVYL